MIEMLPQSSMLNPAEHINHDGDRLLVGWRVGLLQLGPEQQMEIVKLRQGSGKDRQGMALKAKGLEA